MFVGEQPGDREDREGRPFVGPAGRLLDRAMGEAGIDRTKAYVTKAVRVEKVLHVPDALDLPRLLLERLDHVPLVDLAPQDDHAVLGVDVDLALGDVGIAEDLRLDLVRERGVVEVLFLLLQVHRLLRNAVGLGGHSTCQPLALALGATQEAEHPVDGHLPPPLAVLRIEEEHQRGADRAGQRGPLESHFQTSLCLALVERVPDGE